MNTPDPAQAEVLSSGLGVQPDGPLSGEVKREGARFCTGCRATLPESEFTPSTLARGGRCRACVSAANRAYKAARRKAPPSLWASVHLNALSPPLKTPLEIQLAERVRIDPKTGCRMWLGRASLGGYGIVGSGPARTMVHRAAYSLARGEIPAGLVLDHLCRNRRCCNPDHLEPVTNAENVRRGVGLGPVNAAKTSCPAGHEYSPENTYISAVGGRMCNACRRERSTLSSRARRARLKAATAP